MTAPDLTRVALTFDDGPDAATEQMLDVLAAHHAHATFFVIGNKILGREHLLQRMTSEGHQIGIHGWDHKPMEAVTDRNLRGQLRLCRQAVLHACGTTPKLWRSPWNRHTDEQALTILEHGYDVIGVDIDAYDCLRDADQIVETVLDQLRPEVTVLLHDGVAENGSRPTATREQTLLALPRILERCESVTVSELRDLG